ncbi:putative nucleoside-diphosphate-sugar epimerase [Grimontia indica]|uniref:Nucleoside-diphosphate-sugar epimerase n=2 Tax=Vibrionaceae TaxID=641 RepID=R1GLV8_9GAMM|nr:putative nucleoside-diphosphate-sugar epimerase [Grimontia indica]
MMPSKKMLVIGATGYVGSHLVPNLLALGYQVIATSRSLETLKHQAWHNHPNVTLAEVDLLDEGDLSSILSGVSQVFYLVHGMASGSDFYQHELNMARHVSNQIAKSQVSRLIYLGATQPNNVTSTHLAARKVTGNILRDCGKQVIELRAGIIIGSGSAAFEVMRDIVSHLPVITTPVWVRSKSSPVALETMIGYLTKLIEVPVEGSPIFDVSGPEVISYEDQMRRFARIINKRIFIIKVPLLTPKISSMWLTLVTTVPKSIASALIDGLRYDLLPTGKDIGTLIPVPQLGFEQAVESALSNESDVVKNDIWGFDPDAIARWHRNYGYYPKHAGFTVETDATAASLWSNIQKVGGDEGYFFGNWLWKIRAYMDAAVGGNALGKRRPQRSSLETGDYIDSWKVIQCHPQKHLSLLFGMKAPGLGRLEFTVKDLGETRLLDIRAWWHPAGFSGLLYWFAMMPAHLFIFKGMAFALAKKSGAKKTTPSHHI